MNYYDILNVSKNATKKEIKTAYKNLVKKYHPDVYAGDKFFADKKIKEINTAYDILSDDKLRKEYDLSISNGYEFDESAARDEVYSSTTTKSYRPTESYEDFYKSSNNNVNPSDFNPKDNDLNEDTYEKYKQVYNDFAKKKTSYSTNPYTTGQKENYSDYYRASTYRTPSYSSNPDVRNNIQNSVEKKAYSLPLAKLVIFFVVIYFFSILFIIADISKLNTKLSEKEIDSRENIISSDEYYPYDEDIYYNDNYYNYRNNIGDYEKYYNLGEYKVSEEELKIVYEKYYKKVFKTFEEFLNYVEEVAYEVNSSSSYDYNNY